MNFDFRGFDQERHFRDLWESVRIARNVHYALFTFGESVLPYYLICDVAEYASTVSITQGEVRIARPLVITPDAGRPEFQNFFEEAEHEELIEFLLARTASFSNMKFDNLTGPKKIVSDSVEEAAAKLNRKLDEEEEDRVAILIAPPNLGGVAVLRYTAEQVWKSAPDNVQELRERGFLP